MLKTETTNDPATLKSLVREATCGRELQRILRPHDVRRNVMVARLAPAEAIDDDFVKALVGNDTAPTYGLLSNPELADVGISVLVALAMNVIEGWDSPDDRAAAYIATLSQLVPGLDQAISQAIQGGFADKRWQRSHRVGSRASQTLLALSEDLSTDELDWHTDATGSLDVAIQTAIHHPNADGTIWSKAAESRQNVRPLLRTEYRHDPGFRKKLYGRPGDHWTIADLLMDEDDPEILRKHVDGLARTNYHALLQVLEVRSRYGRTLPQDVIVDLLEHDSRAIRERAILLSATPPTKGARRKGRRTR